MKRWILILFIFSTCMLSGCTGTETCAPKRLVTAMEISCQQYGQTLERCYSRDASMETVLRYLRRCQPVCRAVMEVLPSKTRECRVIMCLSDGSRRVWYLHNDRFLRQGNGCWYAVKLPEGVTLWEILQPLPSDSPKNTQKGLKPRSFYGKLKKIMETEVTYHVK